MVSTPPKDPNEWTQKGGHLRTDQFTEILPPGVPGSEDAPAWAHENLPVHDDADAGPEAAAQSSQGQKTTDEEAAAAAEQRKEWASRWRSANEWICTPAPRPDALLTYRPEGMAESADALRMGKVAMMASLGGTGKSWALCDLAIAVATGTRWLDAFDVAKPGAVLLVLAEEDAEEVHRRLYFAAKRRNLTQEQREDASALIWTFAGAGLDCTAQTVSETEVRIGAKRSRQKGTDPTPFGEWLHEQADRCAFRLVLIDPASRLMPTDAEVDNAIATRWVGYCESLAQTQGGPAVIFAHHMSKTSADKMRDGADAGQGAARGASALTDGVRSQWNLAAYWTRAPGNELARVVALDQAKNNYGPKHERVWLQGDKHGALGKCMWRVNPDNLHPSPGELESTEKKAAEEAAKQKSKGQKKSAKPTASSDAMRATGGKL